MKRSVTIVEVAKRANVALSTVSRVLNGGYASPEAQASVEKAARELGFVPSQIARNLKKGLQGCIGLVAESSQGTWFLQLLGGVEEVLQECHLTMVLGSLVMGAPLDAQTSALAGKYDPSAVMQWLSGRRVDGLLMAGGSERERPIVDLATKRHIPMVFVAPDAVFDAGPVFRARNRDGGSEVAEHLGALGHQRVAFVGGPRDSIDTQERLRGLREGLEARGFALRASEVVFAGTYGPEGGIDYAKAWLADFQNNDAPSAVVLANDSLALGFMRTVLRRGVRIPQDVSVVGFDGTPEGALYWPGLTSGEQPTRTTGAAACRALISMMNGDKTENSVEMPITLRIRESTGPANTQSAANPPEPPTSRTESSGIRQ